MVAGGVEGGVQHRPRRARPRSEELGRLPARCPCGTQGWVPAVQGPAPQHNRRLSRRIADAGFGEIRCQLAYKTGWNGGRLVVAGRWYPSSKTCSACGAVKAKLTLAERTYHCTVCGLVLDRDPNAARNFAALADPAVVEVDTAGSGPVAGRGADQRPASAGR
ncbi:MAG: zinc ribbon domain-containing protein [Actinoplanes sp.]